MVGGDGGQQAQAGQTRDDLRDEQDNAAVVRVDDYAADEAAEQGCDETDQADEGQAQRRVGDGVDLPQNDRLKQGVGDAAGRAADFVAPKRRQSEDCQEIAARCCQTANVSRLVRAAGI